MRVKLALVAQKKIKQNRGIYYFYTVNTEHGESDNNLTFDAAWASKNVKKYNKQSRKVGHGVR